MNELLSYEDFIRYYGPSLFRKYETFCRSRVCDDVHPHIHSKFSWVGNNKSASTSDIMIKRVNVKTVRMVDIEQTITKQEVSVSIKPVGIKIHKKRTKRGVKKKENIVVKKVIEKVISSSQEINTRIVDVIDSQEDYQLLCPVFVPDISFSSSNETRDVGCQTEPWNNSSPIIGDSKVSRWFESDSDESYSSEYESDELPSQVVKSHVGMRSVEVINFRDSFVK